MPNSKSLGRLFCQRGFVTVPALDPGEIKEAASRLLPPNAPPFQPQFCNSAHFHEPFRVLFRKPAVIGALRSLLGEDFVFINEFSLHDSYFSGWHTDTSSPEAKGNHEFHWSPTYLMLNAAIYLQDNGPNGGGLDVVPGSHLADDPLAVTLRGGTVDNPYAGVVSIHSKAGDLILFHQRLSHRATPSPEPARSDAERKFALFMIAGPDNAGSRRYREWLTQYDVMNGASRPVIPDEFRNLMAKAGLRVI